MPVNLSVTLEDDNTVLVMWEDSLNMLTENGTYQLSYNISVTSTEVILLMGEVEIAPNNSTELYSYRVSVEGFIQPGVSVNVVVVACDSVDVSPAVNANVSTPGGKCI